MKRIHLFYAILLFGFSNLMAQAGCLSDIIISGSYTTFYTNSYTWIKTSGVTTIPGGADVTLDANPATSGYVLMEDGFETLPNSTYLAIVQTPCQLLGTDQFDNSSNINVYPNPVSNIVYIKTLDSIIQISIFDVNGRLVYETTVNQVDVSMFEKGIYIFKVSTESGRSIQKIIKK